MEIISETITIVFIQTKLRTYPDIAYLITTNLRNLIARQFVRGIEILSLAHRGER